MSANIGAIYAVPLAELRVLPGTKRAAQKKKLVRMILKDFIGREEIDEMAAEFDLDGPPTTLAAAAQHILDGGPLLDDDRGFLYGYAVEALCWAIGNTHFLPMDFPSYEAMDAYLTEHGSPVTLEKLLFSGFPLTIPDPDCYPSAGVWEHEDVRAASTFLASLPDPEGPLGVGIGEIRAWVADALSRPGEGLVGFWY